VGASICGNYNLGGNFTNESTTSWGPGTAVSRTIGGDDFALGSQQSIATLNGMDDLSFDPPPGAGTLVLTNRTCTGSCTTLPAGAFNSGVQWSLNLALLGANDDTANAVAGVATPISVLANDSGYTDPVTVTIDSPPDNGGSAVVVGSPGAPGAISITYTALANFTGTETFSYRAVSGALDDVATVTVTVSAPPDTTPDAFSFTDQTDVALSTVITSNVITVSGINAAAAISVTGGEYSINGGAYTAAAGTVTNGQSVTVRQTSSASASTATNAVLTIGGVSDTFTVTTAAPPPDTTPDAFSFTDQTNVAVSTVIVSNAVVVAGIDAAAPISVTGGEYSIDGGAYTAAAGTVNNGQSVTLRQTSSASASTATNAVLTIGGVSDTFTVTTAAASGGDLTPDQFTFTDQEGVDYDTEIVSDPVTITGIDGAAPIAVTGGEYSINGGAFTSAAGTVTNGQQVRVRHTSASTSGTAVTTILSVGPAGAGTQVSDAFSSSTPRSGGSSSVDGLMLGLLGLLGLARSRRRR
jgi:MYXO-CTERM domain-containing protein